MNQAKWEMDWKAILRDMDFDKILAMMRGMGMSVKTFDAETAEFSSKVPETIHDVIEPLVSFIDDTINIFSTDREREESDMMFVFTRHPYVIAFNPNYDTGNFHIFFAPYGVSGSVKNKITVDLE